MLEPEISRSQLKSLQSYNYSINRRGIRATLDIHWHCPRGSKARQLRHLLAVLGKGWQPLAVSLSVVRLVSRHAFGDYSPALFAAAQGELCLVVAAPDVRVVVGAAPCALCA